MPAVTHETWTLWFYSLPENESGNRNMAAFTNALDAGKSEFEKVKNLTDNVNNVFLAVDGKRMIKIFHSPKNFGGTLLRPSHKVACLTGLGRSEICVQIDLTSAVADSKLVTPSIEEFEACTTAQDVRDLPIPDIIPGENEVYSYEGSNIMLPAPWLRDTIMNADTLDPFELIPIVIAAAKTYDEAHNTTDADRAAVHADDFCSWAWGAGVGRIQETLIEINADDAELESFRIARHNECITSSGNNTEPQPIANNLTNNADILQQLTASIARQTEEAATSNQLRKDEIERKRELDDEKKDRTKKIHKSIIRMLENASATSAMEIDLDMAESCMKFINSDSKGTAAQELSHQFEELNLTDVCFAPGIVQKLYLGEFINPNTSTPNNFTPFAFYEQAPLSSIKQDDYIICHLIQEHGIKQTSEEIKSSLKQEVIVPKDFTSLGVQLQYFVGAIEIFFGSESIATMEMRRLLLQVGQAIQRHDSTRRMVCRSLPLSN